MEKIASNRSFGLVFFVVFFIIALWPLLNGDSIRLWSAIIASVFLILGAINSKLLNPLKILWIKFGEKLGRIIAPIIMALVYFIVLTPIGILMRILGKDLLNLKYSKEKTYWIVRDKNIGPMKRQF
tara:strand:+ start:40 stop:417 length:378 start_codon:yes stop_codon:yes gene_type:complete